MNRLKNNTLFQHLPKVPVLIGIVVLGLVLASVPQVLADRFDQQIRELNQQNSESRAEQRRLREEATTLEAVIAQLQEEIATLEQQINDTEAEKKDVEHQIAEAEAELERQKGLMATNLRTMYLEGDMTTLEMLATSRDLGEFVDKQQYRESVSKKIKDTLDKITLLKAQLRDQKDKLEKLIADQKQMQSELSAQRAEQDRLLGMNKSQQRAYEEDIRANNAKISELRRQQAIENARLFGNGLRNVPDTSGYPWANFEPFPNAVADPWGMYLRQCVSYTAWKVWKSGRHMPYWGGRGNANQWDDNARAAGIPVDNIPRVGDVAVSNAGFYGHVMYVEHVYEDGRILISQYNGAWDGKYSEAIIWPGSLVFIHFP